MKSDKHLLMLLWAIYLFAIIVVVVGAGSEAIAAVLKSGVNQQWLTVAPIFTPFVALAAVWVAYRQLSLNRKNQRETTAKATFREFLKLCVQYPDLADGKPTSGKQDEYEWFVAYFLWAAEEILEYSGKDWETIHDAVMALPPDERRDRAKVNDAVRDGLRLGPLRPAGSTDRYGVPRATE